MNRSIRAIRPRAHRVRLALLGGLLATTLTGVLAGPVRADGYEHGPGRRAWQDHGREHGRGPPPRYEGPRYQGYYREPDVYYSAPPVVVYQPPGPSLNFSFPLFR